MARLVTKSKKKTVRVGRRGINRFALAPTDNWYKAKHFVHYEIESKEWGTQIFSYIKKHYDKKTLASINRLPEWKVSNFSHWATVAFLLEVNPDIVPDSYKTGIATWIAKLIAEGNAVADVKKETEAVKKNVYVPNIQERINEQAQEACDAIEAWLEEYLVDPDSFNPRGFDFVSHFARTKISQAHARKIKKYYEGWLEEAVAVANMPSAADIKKIKDEREADLATQMREGYAHIKKANAKKWQEALENLMSACDMLIDSAKAVRKPRVKKALNKEKMISKLKYKDRDDRYQLVSVNPIEIVDADEVWVFNTKTRKLGKYVAEDHATIKVKGTTLQFYDETKSVQKTLRKPEETLKEFKRVGKVALRKFLDNINSVETKLNGRLNEDTVILRVI
jgi:hypothetical protein